MSFNVNVPVPPRIPGDAVLKTLELEDLKIDGPLDVTGDVTISGDITISGDLTANSVTTTTFVHAGTNVQAGTTVTAGTGITSTAGNIVATAGAVSAGTTVTGGTGVTATTGNVTATAGNVVGVGLQYSTKTAYSQLTNSTTAVPITSNAGTITTQSMTTATTATTTFAITGANILASSQIMLTLVSYSGTPLTNGVPVLTVSGVGAGTANINVTNYGANALSGTLVFNYMIV